jgi:hypothetical protein
MEAMKHLHRRSPGSPAAGAAPSRLRWAAPPLLGLALVGAFGVAPQLAGADDPPTLPDISAAQLIEKIHSASLPGLSGTVRLESHLGLPDVGAALGPRGAPFTELLSGSHTAMVWFAGPDKARVALPDALAEKDVVRNGQDLWLWQSDGQQVTHVTLDGAGRAGPGHDGGTDDHGADPTAHATPAQLATDLLDAVDPTTRVAVRNTAIVAGRPAYELVLSPKSADTLVADAVLAVDARQGRHDARLRARLHRHRPVRAAQLRVPFLPSPGGQGDGGQFPRPGARAGQRRRSGARPARAAGTRLRRLGGAGPTGSGQRRLPATQGHR